MDKKKDDQFTVSDDEAINITFTKRLVQGVDSFQCGIEKDSSLGMQNKIRYLRGMENLLKFYVIQANANKGDRFLLYNVISAFEECIQADKKGLSIAPVFGKLTYAEGEVVIRPNQITFEKNPGYKASLDWQLLKYCQLYPEKAFQTMKENPGVPFADSLVRTISRKYPRQLYNYAGAANELGAIIRNINDDRLISSVARMAQSKNGQQYFPFLDNIVKGKISFEEIDSVKDDSVAYYRLLVKTQMDYVERALQKDTAFEFKALGERLEKKARENFVDVINGLHNENAETRFKCIQGLNAQELYYLAALSDGVIYTSSFVKGVYPLMMKKINNRGDSLLTLLRFDKYRKLIRMAAGYNKLDHFLATFPPAKNKEDETEAAKLMKAFVGRLEQGNGLEDGADVADSYASIVGSLQPVAKEMLKNVQANYQRNLSANNQKGIAIYKILNHLFLSADSANEVDLTKELGIPPVYSVWHKDLADDSGRVVMQVFFHSDIKVQGIYNEFVNMFRNSNWKIVDSAQWVCISAVKGNKPVFIYANKAPVEENGEDEKAQDALVEYMRQHKLYPSVTIHRGHSYTAPYTINKMFTSSKIVFLGSCGGYQIIHDVLERIPDAHIIATKQIADAEVNTPFFRLLTDKVRKGNDIEWIPFWKELDRMVTATIFEDYMPPYKNLGALFIKACKKAMGEELRENQ